MDGKVEETGEVKTPAQQGEDLTQQMQERDQRIMALEQAAAEREKELTGLKEAVTGLETKLGAARGDWWIVRAFYYSLTSFRSQSRILPSPLSPSSFRNWGQAKKVYWKGKMIFMRPGGLIHRSPSS